MSFSPEWNVSIRRKFHTTGVQERKKNDWSFRQGSNNLSQFFLSGTINRPELKGVLWVISAALIKTMSVMFVLRR